MNHKELPRHARATHARKKLEERVQFLEARVTELQTANSGYLQRARDAEAEVRRISELRPAVEKQGLRDDEIREGMPVQASGGDYVFKGYVVAKFEKMNGKIRYSVENEDRVLHIFSARSLVFWDGKS